MSQDKLLLAIPAMGKPKRPLWPWILGGIVIVIAVVSCILLIQKDPEDTVAQAPPMDSDVLGMQDWAEWSELTRQIMDDVLPEDENEIKDEIDNSDPFLIKGRITRNQTLFVALKNHGLNINDIQQVISSMQDVVDFKKTKPGDKYEVHLDVDKRILKFVYTISPEDISIAERQGNVFIAQKVDVHKRVERIMVKGELTSSLYQSFIGLGEKGELASRFMQLFKYDIDFGSDSQRGDSFSVLVDKVTLNGEFYKYGRVWAATYESGARAKQLEAYYFDSSEADFAGYYDASGRALRRAFLKTPVIGCRMTSKFDPKRIHPILKRMRPHNGIDWGCPTGTPVLAFADGVVTFAEWKGGNGNLLVLEHAHGYVSLYAHLYGFAAGIKKGTKVKQGQFVARTGNTGLSTGPHLHFGVKLNDKYIDPATIDSTRAFSLTGAKLNAFNASRDKFKLALNGKSGTSTDVTAEYIK